MGFSQDYSNVTRKKMTLTQKKFFLSTVIVASAFLVGVTLTPTAWTQVVTSPGECSQILNNREPDSSQCKEAFRQYGPGEWYACELLGEGGARTLGRVWARDSKVALTSCIHANQECAIGPSVGMPTNCQVRLQAWNPDR